MFFKRLEFFSLYIRYEWVGVCVCVRSQISPKQCICAWMRVFFIFCDSVFTFIYLQNIIHIDWTEIAIVAWFSCVALRWGGDYVGDREYGYPYKRLIFAVNITEPSWKAPYLMASIFPVRRRTIFGELSKDSIKHDFPDASRHPNTLPHCRQHDIPPMQRHEPLTESRMAWHGNRENHLIMHHYVMLFVRSSWKSTRQTNWIVFMSICLLYMCVCGLKVAKIKIEKSFFFPLLCSLNGMAMAAIRGKGWSCKMLRICILIPSNFKPFIE